MTSWTHRGIRRERIYVICEWLASFALFLLPVFFLLFCMVLFGVWYFCPLEWWLSAASTLLVACMSLTAGVFAIASASFTPPRDTLVPAEHCQQEDAEPVPPLDFMWMRTVPCHNPTDNDSFRINCFNIDCTRRATGRATCFSTGKPPCR